MPEPARQAPARNLEATAASAAPRPWETLALLALMILLMFKPNFADGNFNHTETGMYLGNIHALFQGKVPYRDIFVQFGPLNDYLPALALKLFGPTVYTLRAFFFWSAILTVLAGWWLARRCLGARPFWYASALVLVYEVFNPAWAAYWGGFRHLLGLLALLALLRSLDSPRPRLWRGGAGALCALALLTSIEVGLLATAAAGLFLLVQARREGRFWAGLPERLGPLAAGWAAVMAPLLIYFAATGALAEYLRIAFYEVPFNHMAKFGQRRLIALGPADLSARTVLAWVFSPNFKMYLPLAAFALGAWRCLLAWRAKAFGPWHYRVLLLLAYGLPLYLLSFRQFGGPQSQAAFTAPIVLGFMLLERACQPLLSGWGRQSAPPQAGPRSRSLAWPALALAAALVYLLGAQNMAHGSPWGLLKNKGRDYARFNRHDPNLTPLTVPGSGGVWISKKEAAGIIPAVEFLLRHTRPGEPIIVMPEAGALHFLADRPNPLRFSTTALAYTTPRYQEEVRAQLAKNPVRIVVKLNKRSGHAKHAGKEDYDLLPAFHDLVATHYHQVASLGPISILLHNKMQLEAAAR